MDVMNTIEYELQDVNGRTVREGEEYYFFEKDGREVIVHIEDVANFLGDERLKVDDYEILIKLLEVHYDAYPQIM